VPAFADTASHFAAPRHQRARTDASDPSNLSDPSDRSDVTWAERGPVKGSPCLTFSSRTFSSLSRPAVIHFNYQTRANGSEVVFWTITGETGERPYAGALGDEKSIPG
jgi:hypothetical protein